MVITAVNDCDHKWALFLQIVYNCKGTYLTSYSAQIRIKNCTQQLCMVLACANMCASSTASVNYLSKIVLSNTAHLNSSHKLDVYSAATM